MKLVDLKEVLKLLLLCACYLSLSHRFSCSSLSEASLRSVPVGRGCSVFSVTIVVPAQSRACVYSVFCINHNQLGLMETSLYF